MIYILDDNDYSFPLPYDGEDDGLIAVGGDLHPDRLLSAYSNGIFPWYGFKENPMPLWFCPLRRFVIFPHQIHISHSMRTLLNKGTYHVTFGEDFDSVIAGCARGRLEMEGAWLGEDMQQAYTTLNRRGFATSVEVRQGDGKIVGGLYGVTDGRCFFGESMFSEAPSASKIALISLASKMAEEGRGGLIDCQFETPHLRSMGGRYITYDRYMDILTGVENIGPDTEE